MIRNQLDLNLKIVLYAPCVILKRITTLPFGQRNLAPSLGLKRFGSTPPTPLISSSLASELPYGRPLNTIIALSLNFCGLKPLRDFF